MRWQASQLCDHPAPWNCASFATSSYRRTWIHGPGGGGSGHGAVGLSQQINRLESRPSHPAAGGDQRGAVPTEARLAISAQGATGPAPCRPKAARAAAQTPAEQCGVGLSPHHGFGAGRAADARHCERYPDVRLHMGRLAVGPLNMLSAPPPARSGGAVRHPAARRWACCRCWSACSSSARPSVACANRQAAGWRWRNLGDEP